MNLELPFPKSDPAALDEVLEAIDEELDTLFLDELDGVLRRICVEKDVKPDVAVVFYNDHGLNFFLDKMPTFAIGAAPEYRNADEGWGIPTVKPFRGDPELSWHVIEQLVGILQARGRQDGGPSAGGRTR